MLSSSQGQGNFQGLKASSQGQGLNLRGKAKTTKCVLKDSTSGLVRQHVRLHGSIQNKIYALRFVKKKFFEKVFIKE